MHIGHNTAIGGDSNNLRILGFWIEREVQNPLLFTWLNQELDKEQIESKRLIHFPVVFLQYFPRIWVDRNTGVFLARKSHGGGGDLTPRIIFDGLCMASAWIFPGKFFFRSIKQELLSALTWILYRVTERLKVDRVISVRIGEERLLTGYSVKIHGLDGSSNQ